MNGSIEGHSADVRLTLLVDGRTFPLAQVGPDRCILREPAHLPACSAEILMQVDGHTRRWPVQLFGAALDSPVVNFRDE